MRARTVTARRRRTRVLDTLSLRLGTTRTVIGADSRRGRVASPGKTARTRPLRCSSTLADHVPSTAHTAPVTRVQAEPADWYSTSSAAPEGEEPSAKCSSPDTREGLTPRTVLEVCIVSAATGAA